MKYSVMDLIESSPAFKEATTLLNEVINEANRRKLVLTKPQLDALREFRILATIAKDSRVQKEVANEVYDLIKEKKL